MRNEECVFCKISNKEIPSNIVYEDESICCFLDIDPINEGHVLIVPKGHYNDIDELDDETLMKITKLSRKLTTVIKKIFNPDGYTIMQNGGAFADFGHYHVHVFPRYKDDEFGWTCKELNKRESLDSIQDKLMSRLDGI